MLRVGIFAPYVRNEVALTAVQFADWMVRLGVEVDFLSSQRIESGIHPVWDHRVARARRGTIYRWAYQATHLCWFTPDQQALHHARLAAGAGVRRHCRSLSFPNWGNWSRDWEAFLDQTDRAICLSKAMHQWVQDRYNLHSCSASSSWVDLALADQLLVPKYGLVDETTRRLLVMFPRFAIRDLGAGVVTVFDQLLQEQPELQITIVLESSVCRMYRRELHQLQRRYSGRVQVHRGVPYYSLISMARDHDWVYLASTRHYYGSLLALLASSTVPLICHDISPVEAHVQQNQTGNLIPCQLAGYDYPVADVNLQDVKDVLSRTLHRPHATLKSQQVQASQVLPRKQQSFQRYLTNEIVDECPISP